MNATSNTVTNGVPLPNTAIDRSSLQQDIVNLPPPGNNSFIFGASNFGSVSTHDAHNLKSLNKSMKSSTNHSPFQVQGKTKQMITRAEKEAQDLADAKKMRKDRRERTVNQAE